MTPLLLAIGVFLLVLAVGGWLIERWDERRRWHGR